MIWDFRGTDAERTAQHHCIHLKEYAAIEKLNFYKIDTLQATQTHHIAFMIVDEVNVPQLRKVLKPHRGQLA